HETNLNNLVFTGIPMQWLTAGIKDLVHCDRVVLVLDVCHGGAVAPGSKGLFRSEAFSPDALAIGTGQMVLVSSEADQISWESKKYPNGVFTRQLIDGLRLKNDRTTIGEAYEFLRAKVEEEVLRDRAEVQTPVLIKRLWRGDDLAIAIKPTMPRPGLMETQPPATAASAITSGAKAKTAGGGTRKAPLKRTTPAVKGKK
ncbi:MAG TPA: caspase family protein, partial [Candidatus Obscuribacterales bacterium]